MRTSLIVLSAAWLVAVGGCGESDEGYIDQMRKTHKRAQRLAALGPAQQCVDAFHARMGRYPKTLDELKALDLELPEPPDGMRYTYSAETGRVDLEPLEPPK
jgi:hypothetical protein